MDILERLLMAVVTASNDDRSAPGTKDRERHIQRMDAMYDAVDEISGLRRALTDAINRNKGGVPDSALPFYDPQRHLEEG